MAGRVIDITQHAQSIQTLNAKPPLSDVPTSQRVQWRLKVAWWQLTSIVSWRTDAIMQIGSLVLGRRALDPKIIVELTHPGSVTERSNPTCTRRGVRLDVCFESWPGGQTACKRDKQRSFYRSSWLNREKTGVCFRGIKIAPLWSARYWLSWWMTSYPELPFDLLNNKW